MIRFRLERRETTPVWVQIGVPILAILAALVLCSVLVKLAGADVLEAYSILFLSTFQTSYDVEDTLIKAAPLLLTGLAVAVAFRARFWNIGAEGQLMAGAVAAAYVGGLEFLPDFALVPLMIVGAAVAGCCGRSCRRCSRSGSRSTTSSRRSSSTRSSSTASWRSSRGRGRTPRAAIPTRRSSGARRSSLSSPAPSCTSACSSRSSRRSWCGG